jgi:hypothetical protein
LDEEPGNDLGKAFPRDKSRRFTALPESSGTHSEAEKSALVKLFRVGLASRFKMAHGSEVLANSHLLARFKKISGGSYWTW